MSKKKGGKKKGSTAVLTSSPYKDMLEEEKKKQEEALEAKRLKLEDDEEVNDEECIFCGESYSNSLSGEGWIRCSVCFNWAHDKCAAVEDDDPDDFICDLCAQKSNFKFFLMFTP
ncbi:hypothetical protein JTB14_020355 [Gonioctena quinquepunctata]|nr:hypothetical protein JTB14_020355 [Gonioctena quinquepunctata]